MVYIREFLQSFFAVLFTLMARFVMWRFKPTVIAITGNVGKTSTKDIMFAVLKTQRSVGGTIRSQNSSLTTPLSILGFEVKSKERSIRVWIKLIVRGIFFVTTTKTFPEILVLEVGAGAPGDITAIAKWLRPHVSVFTALQASPVHLDFFDDREQLFKEKKQLEVYTRPTGTVIYNSDDEFLPKLLSDSSHHVITVGHTGEVCIKSHQNTNRGVACEIVVRGVLHKAVIPYVWGLSYVRSLALSLAVAVNLGLDISDAVDNFHKHFKPNPGRMRVLRGIRKAIVIDDSYNASPIAVHTALDTLRELTNSGRKIFLFGDMKELADNSMREHKQVGTHARKVVDMFITVGVDSKLSGETAVQAGLKKRQVKHFDDSDSAGKWLATQLDTGDVVLAKSSRHAIQMERALKHLVVADETTSLVQEYL